MRQMRLLVDVPTGGTVSFRLKKYGGKRISRDETRPVKTRVFAVRRMLCGDKNSASCVEVEAFIPKELRDGVPAYDSRWKSPGILYATAPIYQNRTTLAPFLESGEFEIRFPEDTDEA